MGMRKRQLGFCPVRLNSTCLSGSIWSLSAQISFVIWFYFFSKAGVNTISSAGISVSAKKSPVVHEAASSLQVPLGIIRQGFVVEHCWYGSSSSGYPFVNSHQRMCLSDIFCGYIRDSSHNEVFARSTWDHSNKYWYGSSFPVRIPMHLVLEIRPLCPSRSEKRKRQRKRFQWHARLNRKCLWHGVILSGQGDTPS